MALIITLLFRKIEDLVMAVLKKRKLVRYLLYFAPEQLVKVVKKVSILRNQKKSWLTNSTDPL